MKLMAFLRFRRTTMTRIVRRLMGDRLAADIAGRRLADRLRNGTAVGLRDATIDYVCGQLKPGQTCLDVGALGGGWTYRMAETVGVDGLVLAVEAHRFYAKVLRRAFKQLRFGRVEIINCALGAGDGIAKLKTRYKGDELLGCSHIDDDASNPGSGTDVRMTTLDAIWTRDQRLNRCAVLKIDTEGYEPFVIEGGANFLRRVRPMIVCEICDEWLMRYGWNAGRTVQAILSMGYGIEALDGVACTNVDAVMEAVNARGSVDVIFRADP